MHMDGVSAVARGAPSFNFGDAGAIIPAMSVKSASHYRAASGAQRRISKFPQRLASHTEDAMLDMLEPLIVFRARDVVLHSIQLCILW